MNQSIVRYILFLLAYVPIYIIASLKTIDKNILNNFSSSSLRQLLFNNKIPFLLISLSIILILYFLIYSKFALNPKGNPIFTIKQVKQQHKEYVTYLGTYILPFVSIETKTIFDEAAVVFMFLTIGFIFSKTNLIYTNPTLAFFGFEIYEVETEDGKTYDCISKDKFINGDKPCGYKLGENTFIISKWEKQN